MGKLRSLCELYITDQCDDMFENAFLIRNNEKVILRRYCNTGFFQDSVIAGVALSCGEIIEEIIAYFPHGKRNSEGNKIIVYKKYCDDVVVFNKTKDILQVNKKYFVKSGEKIKL